MQSLKGLVARFARDESGVFAVLFGLMAIVLIAMGGAVVDFVALEQTRNRAQVALDAAALSLQPEIFDDAVTDEMIRQRAEALVINRIGDEQVTATVDSIVVNDEEGSLLLSGRLDMPTMFVRLVGVPEMAARFTAEATRKQLALEVVMVLDNSGSMLQQNRMTYLKDAANCATYTLFFSAVEDLEDNANTCINTAEAELVDNVKVGIVPFTMYVNVGTGNRNAAWLDGTGASVIANDNFDNDDDENTPYLSAVNRFTLFQQTGQSWRGCVEARPHIATGTEATEFLDTDDSPALAGNTLFVPLFSPDLVDSIGLNNYLNDSPAICDRPSTNNGNCKQTQRYASCNSDRSNNSCYLQSTKYEPQGDVNFTSNQKFAGGYYGAHAPSCTCRNGWTSWGSWVPAGGSGNNRTFDRSRTCSGGGYVPTGLDERELQERLCKYRVSASNTSFSRGPNADCTRSAILPLTDDPGDVIDAIDAMIAEGGTNVHEGTAWGYRVISPDAPFTEAEDYDQATSKVLIIMTDGENTAYNLPHTPWQTRYCGSSQTDLNGNCYYSAYGFPYNSNNNNANSTSGGSINRMGDLGMPTPMGAVGEPNSELVAEMNTRLLQTCANAKRSLTDGGPDKIRIYTIGLATDSVSQSTPQVVRQMLTDCASQPSMAHFPETPSELKSVFAAIANELAALRLAQ